MTTEAAVKFVRENSNRKDFEYLLARLPDDLFREAFDILSVRTYPPHVPVSKNRKLKVTYES